MSRTGTLRNLFTDEEIISNVEKFGYVEGAHRLSQKTHPMPCTKVSRQLLRHWYLKLTRARTEAACTGQGCDSPLCWCKDHPESPENPPAAPAHVGPKVLTIDIETSPLFGAVWGLFNNFLSLEQVRDDWFIMSFSAKWLHSEEVIYMDQRNQIPMEDDTPLLRAIWQLLDTADVVIAHNGLRFDTKKINARFVLNGMKPPSPYRVVDTLIIAKRNFNFTSNKLQYLTDKLTDTKKRSHGKFPGYLLWQQCLIGNAEAWDEMRLYNIDDVRSLEELYKVFLPWDDRSVNLNNYHGEADGVCGRCQDGKLVEVPGKFYFTNLGKYSLYHCPNCGGWSRGRKLLNSLAERRSQTLGVR